MTRKRILYLLVLILLLVLLGGLVYVYLSLSSPESVKATDTDISPGLKHIRSIYAYGEGADKLLTQPYGLAFRDGKLYVGQVTKAQVVVFDENGKPLGVIGKKGRAPGELNAPNGIDVDSAGNVYVADPRHAKVVVYAPGGRLVRELTNVPYPLVPRIVNDNRMYLTAYDSVKVYSLPDFTLLSSWGRRGRADAEYDFPNGIVVSGDGEKIFVADGNNMRLKSLDKNGEKIWIAGQPPKDMNDQNRLFGLPAGMAQVGDVLYVADPLNGTIHLFRTDGTQIGEVGEVGSEEGMFGYPSQIASMGGHRFAVTEWGNDRVQIVDIDPAAVERAAKESKLGGATETTVLESTTTTSAP